MITDSVAADLLSKADGENGHPVYPDNSTTVLFGHLSTEEMSRRKKQDRS
jgi:hypothetical protein